MQNLRRRGRERGFAEFFFFLRIFTIKQGKCYKIFAFGKNI
ncbi:hypothetical protein H1P_560023 [Hyella patelloides LEGE 07179]|uniref:Uncharacterized protein n=1 Tax=Hyella patelloides LEGE 07179 TaxID=945734 RepID=A0A563W0G3_9CYAN|nr:hypothetical protein H1P_560023 [Hyella patelloides LEGE 07179]